MFAHNIWEGLRFRNVSLPVQWWRRPQLRWATVDLLRSRLPTQDLDPAGLTA